jgi:hypothetical protein
MALCRQATGLVQVAQECQALEVLEMGVLEVWQVMEMRWMWVGAMEDLQVMEGKEVMGAKEEMEAMQVTEVMGAREEMEVMQLQVMEPWLRPLVIGAGLHIQHGSGKLAGKQPLNRALSPWLGMQDLMHLMVEEAMEVMEVL